MTTQGNQDGGPSHPYAEGEPRTPAVNVHNLVRDYLEISSRIERLEMELKQLLFEMLRIEQIRRELSSTPQEHVCSDYAVETSIVHEDEEYYFEEPIVSCRVCGDDITCEFYDFIQMEVEEHKEEEFR